MTLGRNVNQDKTTGNRAKSKSKTATDNDKEKSPICDVVYDSGAKCWKTSTKGKSDNYLKITKIQRNKEKQRLRQDPESVPHNRKKAQRESDPDLDQDEDAISISMDVHKEVPRIRKPFIADKPNTDGPIIANWSMPKSARSSDAFRFERPSNVMTTRSSISSPAHQLKRMEQELTEKDKQLDMMRAQLFKSQRANMKLVNELKQCSGQKYGDVVRENIILREQAERLTRQINKMWGDEKRDKNHVIQKLQYEEKLEIQKTKEFTSARD